MPDSGALLLTALALPFAAAAAVVVLGDRLRLRSGWLLLAAAAGSCALLASLAASLDAAAPLLVRLEWLPAIDVALAFRADGFGLFFALLVSGVGVLVVAYSLGYLGADDADRARRYYAALAVFMGAMIGIALSDDLLVLFVFWELTSVSSFLLIGHHFEDDDARAGALTALQVTALGGLVMLVGFLLVGQVAGTYSLSRITADPALVARLLDSPLGTWALLCILVGAFTKSAQVPFHFWLPRAMVAPTPISAYLHAATMVKAGVFLVGRLLPVFGESPLWLPVLVAVGGTSMLLGAYQATREVDLKAILARTTGSILGLLFLLYGIGAAQQDALQMLSHALYKGALFLVAGIVDHWAHTRDLRKLGGLRRALPLPFAACVLAALSMGGIAPLLGFVAKESVYGAVLYGAALADLPTLRLGVLAACVAASALMAATAYRFTAGIFLGAGARAAEHGGAHGAAAPEAGGMLWLSPLILALGCVGFGLAAGTDAAAHAAALLSSVGGGGLELSPLPHLGAPLAATAVTLALAALIHWQRQPLAALGDRLHVDVSAAALWQRGLAGIVRVGEAFSQRWENGSLRWYLAGTLLTFPLATLYAFARLGLSNDTIVIALDETPWYGVLFCLLLAAGALAAVRARNRLAAALASTASGFLVAMLYVVYRSPDILLTQILIETVSTIFLLLVLVHLPQFASRDQRAGGGLTRATVATAVGLTATVLMLLALSPALRAPDSIGTQPGGLLSLALAEGGGANAVNVIIVDIRALDTSGEVAVLVVVGLIVYGLLRTRRGWT